MRWWAAVAAGAILIALASGRAYEAGAAAVFVLAFFALTALGVGFFSARRAWLAAPLALYLGVIAWFALGLRASAPWSSSDVWGAGQWLRQALAYLPLAIGCAALGALGSMLRGMLVRR